MLIFHCQDFALGLSVLLNGSLDQKLRYRETLYGVPVILFLLILFPILHPCQWTLNSMIATKQGNILITVC